MLEAVNSVLSNASMLRNAAVQSDAARTFAANPERIQEIPQAPFVSPYIHLDVNYDKAVLQIRDGDTGDVMRQFPTEQRLQEIRLQQKRVQSTQPRPYGDGVPDAPQRAEPRPSASSFVSTVQSQPEAPQATVATPQQIAAFQSGAQTAQATPAPSSVSVEA